MGDVNLIPHVCMNVCSEHKLLVRIYVRDIYGGNQK